MNAAQRLLYERGLWCAWPLRPRRCNPSQYNTLRYGQAQRRRKLQKKAGRRLLIRYDKQKAEA